MKCLRSLKLLSSNLWKLRLQEVIQAPNQIASSVLTVMEMGFPLCVCLPVPGAKSCTQCQGSGVNSVDHFNGQFKAGGLCWLCRGKREILCGSCNGAGFLGGFMSTFDE
ncbi:hypothetical protein F2P56_023136 [Juglans regia]|uniref:BSD2 cysteine rich domain-containing protein n=1 Tax=Juglans regia TaxID=51240 RepID=A0A833U1S3_JUGRE|nr:hypothetical protein F2P56_023136 [Juglans regia]